MVSRQNPPRQGTKVQKTGSDAHMTVKPPGKRIYTKSTNKVAIEKAARERLRVDELTAALEQLSDLIPKGENEKKWTKRQVLEKAQQYIAELTAMLQDDTPPQQLSYHASSDFQYFQAQVRAAPEPAPQVTWVPVTNMPYPVEPANVEYYHTY